MGNSSFVKVHKSKNYTVMSNFHLRDKRLTLKAKGLLSLVFSLPEEWDYSISGLVSICVENETAIKSALSELKEYKYLTVNKIMPSKDNKESRIRYEYNFYENPEDNKEEEYPKKQGKEIQGIEILQVENQVQLNKEEESKEYKKSTSKDKVTTPNIETTTDKEAEKDIVFSEQVRKIISHLNEQTCQCYRPNTETTRKLIRARMNDGFTVDDFIKVIDNMTEAWLNDTKMCGYLRPNTLFGTKFESYLNRPASKKKKDRNDFSDLKIGMIL